MRYDIDLHTGIQCSNCTRCRLHRIVSHKVGPEGNGSAKLVIVGEAPGPEEYEQMKPFIGKSGKLLRRYLKLAGFAADDCYITNAVKCFPHINGTIVKPPDDAIFSCYSILAAEIDYVSPIAILVLGNVAYKSVVDNKSTGGITKLAGKHKDVMINNEIYRVYMLYHPSYVLRANNKDIEIKFFNVIKDVYKYVYE